MVCDIVVGYTIVYKKFFVLFLSGKLFYATKLQGCGDRATKSHKNLVRLNPYYTTLTNNIQL